MSLTVIDRPKTVDADRLNEYEDWFCLKVDPYICADCGKRYTYAHSVTPLGLIVVWSEKDDPVLLNLAQIAMEVNMNPRIITYEQNFGSCIPYDRSGL